MSEECLCPGCRDNDRIIKKGSKKLYARALIKIKDHGYYLSMNFYDSKGEAEKYFPDAFVQWPVLNYEAFYL